MNKHVWFSLRPEVIDEFRLFCSDHELDPDFSVELALGLFVDIYNCFLNPYQNHINYLDDVKFASALKCINASCFDVIPLINNVFLTAYNYTYNHEEAYDGKEPY